jgi:hypothetical protein
MLHSLRMNVSSRLLIYERFKQTIDLLDAPNVPVLKIVK